MDFTRDITTGRVETLTELAADIDRAIGQGHLALDLESTGLDTRVYEVDASWSTVDQVVGFSYALGPTAAKYCPFGHVARGREHNLPRVEVVDQLRRLMLTCVPQPLSAREHREHPLSYKSRGDHCQLLIWHGQYDLEMLRWLTGVALDHPDAVVDGMIKHHLKYPHLRHGLKSVTEAFLTSSDGTIWRQPKLEQLQYWEAHEDDQLDALGESNEEVHDDRAAYRQLRGTKNFSLTDPSDPNTILYACLDAVCTYRLCTEPYLQLGGPDKDGQPNTDLELERLDKRVSVALRAVERARVQVDRPRVQRLSARLSKACDRVLEQVGLIGARYGYDELSPYSSTKLREIFYERMRITPTRFSKGNKRDRALDIGGPATPSTDRKTLEILSKHEVAGPLARRISFYRKHNKLVSTYLDRLDGADIFNTVRASYSPFKASGRFSAPSRNIKGGYPAHGIPKREQTISLRRLFTARPGHSFLICDYWAQEMCLMASFSRAAWWLDLLGKGVSPHRQMAQALWGVDDDEHKERAKAVNFGTAYGIGDSALADQLSIETAEAASVRKAFFKRVPEFEAWTKFMTSYADRYGYVRTVTGRKLPTWLTFQQNGAPVTINKSYIGPNYRIQGSGSDILRLVLVDLHERFSMRPDAGAQILMLVHDELVIEIRDDVYDEVEAEVLERMTAPYKDELKIPLRVDHKRRSHW